MTSKKNPRPSYCQLHRSGDIYIYIYTISSTLYQVAYALLLIFVCKDAVYRRKVRDLADMRQRIIEAVELITPHMLINTWQELEYRLDICRATTGAHIEMYGRA